MSIFITVLHILAAVFLVAVVLLQQGKGADIGSAFGGGASQTVFGSRGAGNFLTKLTTGFVVMFMGTSIGLTYLSAPPSLLDDLPEVPEAPAPVPTEGQPLPGSGSDPAPAGFEVIPSGSDDGASGEDASPASEEDPSPSDAESAVPATGDPQTGSSDAAEPSEATPSAEPAPEADPQAENPDAGTETGSSEPSDAEQR